MPGPQAPAEGGAAPPSPAEYARRRRGRNVAMLVVLLAVCVLFYAITVVKMAKVG
ncbi:MAG: hypothetical protein JOZ42_14685 [Acetobacteraceae bacterium]|nr:hypothetical protein [Acetobacteraceae bacterium]